MKSVRSIPPSSIYNVNNTNTSSSYNSQYPQSIDLTTDDSPSIVSYQSQQPQHQLIYQPQQMAIQEERLAERYEKLLQQQNQLQDHRMQYYNNQMEQRYEQNNIQQQQILQTFMTQYSQQQTKEYNDRIMIENAAANQRIENFANQLINSLGVSSTIQLGKRRATEQSPRTTDQSPQPDSSHNPPESN